MSKEIRRPKPDKKRLRRTLLMAALESPLGIMNAYEIVTASPRMFGCAISGGDFRKSMHVQIQRDGVEMMVARGQMLLAARAAGVQCFDIKYSLKFVWPMSLLTLIASTLLGVIPF